MGEKLTKEELGGYEVHARSSGVVDNDAADEADAIAQIQRFLSYLPTNVHKLPPIIDCDDPVDRRDDRLASVVPKHRNRGYNLRRMVEMDRRPWFVLRDRALLRSRAGDRIRADRRAAGRHPGQRSDALRRRHGRQGGTQIREVCRPVRCVPSANHVNLADQPGFLIGRPGEGAGTLRARGQGGGRDQ